MEEMHKPERKRWLAIVVAAMWAMGWTGIFVGVGYAFLVQIPYFPTGTIFGILSMLAVVALFGYLTTLLAPYVTELWEGKKKEIKKEEKRDE